MRRRRALLGGPAVVVAFAVACVPVARAQPREEAPPPPVVDNVRPPPVVQNVPPPPVVQNAAPPSPVMEPLPPAPAQPAPRPRESVTKFFLSALGTFVLSYGLTVLVGAIRSAQDDPAGPDLYVPIVGPPLFWAETDMKIDAEAGLYLVLSTLFQTVGLIGTVVSFATIVSDPEHSD